MTQMQQRAYLNRKDNSDLAPKLKLRLLKIEKLRSRSAPLQNRLIEIGARSQIMHQSGRTAGFKINER